MSLLTNFTASSCAFWRGALTRQASGGAPATLLCAADSNGQDDQGLEVWHEGLRARRQAAEPNTWDDGFAFFTFPVANLDPRRTYGTNWVQDSQGQVGPGLHGAARATAPGGTPFTYGPVSCDTYDLNFHRFGNGEFKWSVDDGPLSDPVSVAGEGESGSVVIPAGAPGMHTLKIHAIPTAVQPSFLGVSWTDSTAPRRRIAGSGRFGSATSDWAAPQSLDAMYGNGGLRPDLTWPIVGSNDYGFRDITTQQTLDYLGTWIDVAADAGSGFILTIPAPSNYQPPRLEPPADLAAGLLDLALTKDVPLIDFRAKFIDFPTMQAGGFVSDHVHFSQSGQTQVAGVGDQALVLASGGAIDPDPEQPGLVNGRPVIGYRLNGQPVVVVGTRKPA